MKIKKRTFYVAVSCLVVVIVLFLLAIVLDLIPKGEDKLQVIVLGAEEKLPRELCEERNLQDKVVILGSKYCSACVTAKPRLEEVEEELNADFIWIELSEKAGVARMEEFAISPQYTPTLVVGCDVYIGVKTKDEYRQIIGEFLPD